MTEAQPARWTSLRRSRRAEAAAIEREAVQFDQLDVFGGQEMTVTGKDKARGAGDAEETGAGGSTMLETT